MKPLMTAQSLWGLWVREQTIPSTAAAFPFFERVQDLLEKGEIHSVLDALFEITDELQPQTLLFPMVAQVQRMAQWVIQHEVRGTCFHTQLVAIPLGGDTQTLGDGAPLWEGVESYLQQRFRGRTRRRGQPPLGLTVTRFPTLLAPEVCAALTLDDIYKLTQELAHARPGQITKKLLDDQATFLEGVPIDTPAQYLSVAVITHNADQFPATEGMDDWLNELDPGDWLWQRHLGTKVHAALPPMPLIDALTETLWQRVAKHTEWAAQSLGFSAPPVNIQWAEVVEEDDSDLMNLVLKADDRRLPVLQVPGSWFSLIGPQAIDRFLHMWDEDEHGPTDAGIPETVRDADNVVTSLAERRKNKATKG